MKDIDTRYKRQKHVSFFENELEERDISFSVPETDASIDEIRPEDNAHIRRNLPVSSNHFIRNQLEIQATNKEHEKTQDIQWMKRSDMAGEEEGGEEMIEQGENGVRIVAFNLNAELEEGAFDEEANYIAHADNEQAMDNWMWGISTEDIEKTRQAHERRVREVEARNREEEQDPLAQLDKGELLKRLVGYLHTEETATQALRRLSGSSSHGRSRQSRSTHYSTTSTHSPSSNSTASKRIRTMPSYNVNTTSASTRKVEDMRSFEELSEILDRLLVLGFYNVYQSSYEKIMFHLRKEDFVLDTWSPNSEGAGFHPVHPQRIDTLPEDSSDLFGSPTALPSTTSVNSTSTQSSSSQWIYKWNEDGETYGPFSSEQLREWFNAGYFNPGILVAKWPLDSSSPFNLTFRFQDQFVDEP